MIGVLLGEGFMGRDEGKGVGDGSWSGWMYIVL